MQYQTLKLLERDILMLTKVYQCYFFFKQVHESNLHPDLVEHWRHNKNIIYSLLTSFLTKQRFELEFLEYLNEEITRLRKLPKTYFNTFIILPHEIDEIELQPIAPIRFVDDEKGKVTELIFDQPKRELAFREYDAHLN